MEKTPISILNDGHYQTVVGMRGRNLIIKDSLEYTPRRKTRNPNEDLEVDIDTIFTRNQKKNSAFQICWLQEVNDEYLGKNEVQTLAYLPKGLRL